MQHTSTIWAPPRKYGTISPCSSLRTRASDPPSLMSSRVKKGISLCEIMRPPMRCTKGSWLLQRPWPGLGAKTMVMIISSVCSLPLSTQEKPSGPRSSVEDRTLEVWPQIKFFVSSLPWPLIRLKRIYNFWCSMLVFTPIALCFVYTLWHFYSFFGTNLLTRCHNASSCFMLFLCFRKVTQEIFSELDETKAEVPNYLTQRRSPNESQRRTKG
jgi:hypothetical protein